MKSIVFSILAVLLYAVSNVILELKLSKYQALSILIVQGAVLCVAAFIVRWFVKDGDPSYAFPTGSGLFWVMAACVIFAAADYFYISAYTAGGTLLTITSVVIFFPVMAATMKLTVTGHYPNVWQVVGFAVMACGVLLIAKGVVAESEKTAAAATGTHAVSTT